MRREGRREESEERGKRGGMGRSDERGEEGGRDEERGKEGGRGEERERRE